METTKTKTKDKKKDKANWKIIVVVVVAAIAVGVGISYLLGMYGDSNILYQKEYAWLGGRDEVKILDSGYVYCRETDGSTNNTGRWRMVKLLGETEKAALKEHIDKDEEGELKQYIEKNIGCFHTRVTGE